MKKQHGTNYIIGAKDTTLDKLPTEKRVPEEKKEVLKKQRDIVRKKLKSIAQDIMKYDSKEANEDIKIMYETVKQISNLVIEFLHRFEKVKQEKNMMDFNDIEHFALNILSSSKDNHVSQIYKEKYEEILIDEYQDSNLVQEYILNTISRGNNIFMVGDVKQSIYKFRQARPELFIQKYETYKEKEEMGEKDNLKIQLFKNFRSRENILEITNTIFSYIMSKELGDIDYNEKEYLNLGAEYPKGQNLETELHIIDLKEEEESIYKDEQEEVDEEAEEEGNERIEDILIEAKFVAKKIKELIDTGYLVCNKDKTYRKATYKDFAVLLRSPKNSAPIYEQEISKLNMPVFCDITVRILRHSRNTSNYEFAKDNR